jgi:hypothetical protein
MDGRRLFEGALICVVSWFLLAGTASAHQAPKKEGGAAKPTGPCVIRSLPSFVDQGEFEEHSSIADVIEVMCEPIYAEHQVKLSSQQLYNRCKNSLSWTSPFSLAKGGDIVGPGTFPVFAVGPSFTVTLDDDGNATAVVWGGPSCAPGESLVSGHLIEPPYATFTTAFTVLPPHDTTPGVWALPGGQVEDSINSSVATIVQVEFPSVYAEKFVNISAEQLYARCLVPPHLTWVGPNAKVLAGEAEAVSRVKLDNNGNAFVVLLGRASCASGVSEVEASLEEAPYTTFVNSFTVLSPRTPF